MADKNRETDESARSREESALQDELRREAKEGSDAIGDVRSNRNVGGSSTWETLPEEPASDDQGG